MVVELKQPKVRTSRLAIAAPLLAFCIALLRITNSEGPIAIAVFFIAISSLPVGFLALILIAKSNGTLRGRLLAWIGVAPGCILISAILFWPIHGPHPIAAHEAGAVGTLSRLAKAERRYKTQHHGFACDLPTLQGEMNSTQAETDPVLRWREKELKQFASTRLRAGYLFDLKCSIHDSSRYFVIASPREYGVSGFRTFCEDDSGVIYWTESNPGNECFVKKQALE